MDTPFPSAVTTDAGKEYKRYIYTDYLNCDKKELYAPSKL